jgi:hypothetical protein
MLFREESTVHSQQSTAYWGNVLFAVDYGLLTVD